MKDCISIIDRNIHVFSTVVDTLDIDDIRLGRMEFKNTGGTDFDAVLKHASSKKYQRIVVLTDGWSDVSDDVSNKAVRSGIRVLVGFTEKSGYNAEAFGPQLTLGEFKLPTIEKDQK